MWKDRIYLTAPADGQDAVLAFDLKGKQLWQTKLGPEVRRNIGRSARAAMLRRSRTAKRIYVYFKSGNFRRPGS